MENSKSLAEKVGYLIGIIMLCFASAGFLMWGWNVLAPHLNTPTFTYWETFAIYMGLDALAGVFLRVKKFWKNDN